MNGTKGNCYTEKLQPVTFPAVSRDCELVVSDVWWTDGVPLKTVLLYNK